MPNDGEFGLEIMKWLELDLQKISGLLPVYLWVFHDV